MAGDDAEIIHAVLQGDVDRYAELVDKYQGPALRLAFSFLGNYEDAKDVSQEAFINAYRSLGRFRHAAAFATWLYRIVVNQCKDAYKRRARQPMAVARVGAVDPAEERGESNLFTVEVEDTAAGPSDRLANLELSEQLSAAIGRLPMKQRTAFVLHHLHGLPLGEVAEVMGCRLGTVKSHVFRATEQLRAQLAPLLAK